MSKIRFVLPLLVLFLWLLPSGAHAAQTAKKKKHNGIHYGFKKIKKHHRSLPLNTDDLFNVEDEEEEDEDEDVQIAIPISQKKDISAQYVYSHDLSVFRERQLFFTKNIISCESILTPPSVFFLRTLRI